MITSYEYGVHVNIVNNMLSIISNFRSGTDSMDGNWSLIKLLEVCRLNTKVRVQS